jgi:hypothetical protein
MRRKSAALALAVVVLSVTAVQASPIKYQYTGNPFTFATGPYTTSDFVTITITLAGPLGPNFSGEIFPSGFTFFDGVQTISIQNAFPNGAFFFTTDSTGAITHWDMGVGT